MPDKYRGEAPVAFVKLRPAKRPARRSSNLPGDKINKLEMPKEIILRTIAEDADRQAVEEGARSRCRTSREDQ